MPFEIVRRARAPHGFPITQLKLDNGLEAYVIENHSAPVFTFQAWFRVGSRDEKLDPRLSATGLAHFFEHMMFRGTPTHGNGEFDRILMKSGVHNENATTWLDRTNYYESLPTTALETVFRLEADRMANLVIDDTILDTERGAVLGEYRMGLDDPDTIAFDTLYGTAFTTHPYKYTTIGTEEEIKRFTRADAEYFYRKYYAPNNAVLVIVGDVDPTRVGELMEARYGGRQAQQIDRPRAPREPEQAGERKKQFRHAQLTQPKLFVGYRSPETKHADLPALWLAQSILTQGEASVLQQLWVNTGLAVSIGGFVNQFADPGLFVLMADVQEGKPAEELVAVLDAAVSKLAKGLSPIDLDRARNQLLLELHDQWEENASLASYLGEFIASAGDPLFGFELASRVESAPLEDVKRAIATYLVPSRRTVVVGLPEEGEGERA